MKHDSSPAPQHRLADLRDWLMDRIDGSIETRGEDGLVSDFIRQIDAATAELSDLKQRLLPQFQGRAQRAEHERDALLEQLIEARSAIQRAYGCLWRYTGSSNPMFLQARKMLLARLTKEQQAIGIRYANELFGHTTEHEILHSGCSHDAAPSATGALPVEVAAIPVPTGCGAIFKSPEGWSCDCERDHPAPCAKGKRSDDAGEPRE